MEHIQNISLKLWCRFPSWKQFYKSDQTKTVNDLILTPSNLVMIVFYDRKLNIFWFWIVGLTEKEKKAFVDWPSCYPLYNSDGHISLFSDTFLDWTTNGFID